MVQSRFPKWIPEYQTLHCRTVWRWTRPCYLQHLRTSQLTQSTQSHHKGTSRHTQPHVICMIKVTHYTHRSEHAWCVKLCFFTRLQHSTVTGVTAVGETPEKKQNQNASRHHGPKLAAQKMDTQRDVADTMRASCSTVQNTDSQRKKPEPKPSGSCMIKLGPQWSSFFLLWFHQRKRIFFSENNWLIVYCIIEALLHLKSSLFYLLTTDSL